MGASFCHVMSIVAFFHVILFVILMNHSWKGAAASFTISAVVANIERKCNVYRSLVTTKNSKIPEAID